MICKGSCDTEDWSNDAENSALHHSNKLHFKLKLQAALKGPSHLDSLPPGGFRKSAKGEQYAFQVVNIGGICQSFICAKLPASRWWRYDYNGILACRCLQARPLTKHVKFGANWTLCV